MNTVQLLARQQEVVLADIPDDFTGVADDAAVRGGRDKTAPLFVEVALIVEGQAFAERSLLRDRVVGWWIRPVTDRRLVLVCTSSGVQGQHRRDDLGNSPDREGVRYCRVAIQVGFLGVSRRSCNGDIRVMGTFLIKFADAHVMGTFLI